MQGGTLFLSTCEIYLCRSLQYEIDSLCGFIKLSRSYYESTNDSSFMNSNCMSCICCLVFLFLTRSVGNGAIDQIFRVIDEQSQPTVFVSLGSPALFDRANKIYSSLMPTLMSFPSTIGQEATVL